MKIACAWGCCCNAIPRSFTRSNWQGGTTATFAAMICRSIRRITPTGTRDFRRARSRLQASPHWMRSCIPPSRSTCTSSAETTALTCLRRPSPNTVRTSRSIKSSTSGRRQHSKEGQGRQGGQGRPGGRTAEFLRVHPAHPAFLSCPPCPPCLSLPPVQFLVEYVEVASGGWPNEPHRLFGAAHADLIARVHLEPRLTIARDN